MMENQEKIFDDFKKAADNMESKEFQSVEKIWSRVEDKLDKKVLTKQHNLWKKIAIAASVLLFATLAYEFFKPQTPIAIPENEVAVEVLPPPVSPDVQKPTVDSETQNPQIKRNAPQILQQQLDRPVAVAAEEVPLPESPLSDDIQEPETDMVMKSKKASVPAARSARFEKGRAFDAVGVRRNEIEADAVESEKKHETKIVGNTQAPLIIKDGKAITGKEALQINSVAEGIAKIDPKDEKEIVVLNEPLYIINGHYYTEQELFGPNPTSPYAPLNQQEIETITVFQGEKAVANYGKRGEKGVVVITTKDKKPASKPPTTSAKKAK